MPCNLSAEKKGVPPTGPTIVLTDNKANAMVASGASVPARSRHCMRRFATFLARVKAGHCKVGHVKDPENPAALVGSFKRYK